MKDEKSSILGGFVVVSGVAYIVISGKLYDWSYAISSAVDWNSRTTFIIAGSVLFVICLTIAVLTVTAIWRCLFPSRKHTVTRKYDTYEEAKLNCNMVCLQCNSKSCPVVKKESHDG